MRVSNQLRMCGVRVRTHEIEYSVGAGGGHITAIYVGFS